MLAVYETPEVQPYDPRRYNDELLARKGLVAVGTTLLTRTIYPGMQSRIAIGADRKAHLEESGLTRGQRFLSLAAGDLLTDIALGLGKGPGFAGMTGFRTSPETTEIMASEEVKSAMIAQASQYTGFVLLADQSRFTEQTESLAPAIRGYAEAQEVIGLRLADVELLSGLSRMRDPVEVPHVRAQFELHGIRPEAFAA